MFLIECLNKWLFNNLPVFVMENVKSHHSDEIKIYLESLCVEVIYLCKYSLDSNAIEYVFSPIKLNLNMIRT